MRHYHDATADFVPPAGAAWAVAPESAAPEVICHGDFGPWNAVWRGGRPVGLLDFDFARPGARREDIAYALEYVAPFRDDAECVRWLRYPGPPDRRRRLEVFCAAYGLASADGVVDAVVDEQRGTIDRVRRLAFAGHEPQATWVGDGHLRELERRLAWSEAHRQLFG